LNQVLPPRKSSSLFNYLMKKKSFSFIDPGQLIDHELELLLIEKIPGLPDKGYLPSYTFDMQHVDKGEKMGRISLRIGYTENIRYDGHIGYSVDESYRGNHYAARSCLLILPFAKDNGLNPVWITCNPDNIASRRTCEIAGGNLIEIVDVPAYRENYKRGERQKCRYRFDL